MLVHRPSDRSVARCLKIIPLQEHHQALTCASNESGLSLSAVALIIKSVCFPISNKAEATYNRQQR